MYPKDWKGVLGLEVNYRVALLRGQGVGSLRRALLQGLPAGNCLQAPCPSTLFLQDQGRGPPSITSQADPGRRPLGVEVGLELLLIDSVSFLLTRRQSKLQLL